MGEVPNISGVPVSQNYWPQLPSTRSAVDSMQATTIGGYWLGSAAPLIEAENAVAQITAWQQIDGALLDAFDSLYFVPVQLSDGKEALFVRDPRRIDPELGQGNEVVSEGLGFAMQMANDMRDAEKFNQLLNAALATSGRGLFAWKGHFVRYNEQGQPETVDLAKEATVSDASFSVKDDSDWGSASDADVDIIFELVRAWGYAKDGVEGYAGREDYYAILAQSCLDQLWSKAVYYDGENAYVSVSSDQGKGGEASGTLTSLSYFSVAKFEALQSFDQNSNHHWDAVATTLQRMRNDLVCNARWYNKLNPDVPSSSAAQRTFNVPSFVVVGRDERNPERLFYRPPERVAERFTTLFGYDAIRTYWRIAYDAQTSSNQETRESAIALARRVIDTLGANVAEVWKQLEVYQVSGEGQPEPEMVLSALTALAYVAAFGPLSTRSTAGATNAAGVNYTDLFVSLSRQLSNMYDRRGGFFLAQENGAAGREGYYQNALCYLSTYLISGRSSGITRRRFEENPLFGKQAQIIQVDHHWYDGPWAAGAVSWVDLQAKALDSLAELIDEAEKVSEKDLRGAGLLTRLSYGVLLDSGPYAIKNKCAAQCINLGFANEAIVQYSSVLRFAPYPIVFPEIEEQVDEAMEGLAMALNAAGVPQREKVRRVRELIKSNETNPYPRLLYAKLLLDSYDPEKISEAINVALDILKNPAYTRPRLVLKAFMVILEGYKRMAGLGGSFDWMAGDTELMEKNLKALTAFVFSIDRPVPCDLSSLSPSMSSSAATAEAKEAERQKMAGVRDKVVAAYRSGGDNNEAVDLKPALHYCAAEIYLEQAERIYNSDQTRRDTKIRLYKKAIHEYAVSISYGTMSKGLEAGPIFGLSRCFRALGQTYALKAQDTKTTDPGRAYRLSYYAFGVSLDIWKMAKGEEVGDELRRYLAAVQETDVNSGWYVNPQVLADNLEEATTLALGREREKLLARTLGAPRSIIGLKMDIDQAWRMVGMSIAGVTADNLPGQAASDTFSEAAPQIMEGLFFRGRVRPHFEKIAYYVGEGEMLRAKQECQNVVILQAILQDAVVHRYSAAAFRQRMKRIILPKEQYDTVRSLYNDIFVILRDTPEVEEALLKVDAAVLSFMFGEGKNMLRGYAVSEDLDAYVDKIASPKQLLDQLELELGFIFDPEQREMVAGLYGDIKEALASTSDASEALVEVHDAVLAFVQVIEEEARNGPADQETGSYAAGDLINTSAFGVLKSYLAQRGPAFDLLSKLEMALENSTVIESYADRLSDAEGRGGAAVAAEWEDIGREARVLARVHTISVLLDEGDIEKIRKEIEITVKSCRDILGEEPYPEGWFDEALNMIQAYAWGRAFSGSNYENLDEARAIYREMLNEPYQIAIPAGQTNDLLTIIRNKENAGNIRRAMSAGSEYEWKTWMQYGDMLLALYYHEKQKQKARLAAEGVAEEELEDKALEAIGSNQIIINALAEAYFAFDVADQIRPDDGRAGSKMTDVADLCRELGFEIEDYRDDWAFRRRPEESEE